ncbi:hypothetical protein LINPERHAP1_LOCUS28770, partial [Linum perenne]
MSTVLQSNNLNSFVDSVPLLEGNNYAEWKEHVEFYLGVLDIDHALTSDQPAALTDISTAEDKTTFNSWTRANKLC